MKIKLLWILPLLSMLIFSCDKGRNDDASNTKIKVKLYSELTIEDPRILKIIDSYFHYAHTDIESVYQLIIGSYENQTASLYLDIIAYRSHYKRFKPIGSFKYKGKTVLVYSAMMDFSLVNEKMDSAVPNMEDSTFNDLSLKPGQPFPRVHFPIWKINISRNTFSGKDSIWVEKGVVSPFNLLPRGRIKFYTK